MFYHGNAKLSLIDWKVIEVPTIADYIASGWQVSMVAAVDYTASNGAPSTPESLHFLGPNNQYENSISWIGKILENYDYERKFPVFGFGGIPRHTGINNVSHCFPMNGNERFP